MPAWLPDRTQEPTWLNVTMPPVTVHTAGAALVTTIGLPLRPPVKVGVYVASTTPPSGSVVKSTTCGA